MRSGRRESSRQVRLSSIAGKDGVNAENRPIIFVVLTVSNYNSYRLQESVEIN